MSSPDPRCAHSLFLCYGMLLYQNPPILVIVLICLCNQDKEIQQCLLYLASFLPQNQTSVLRKNAEHRLRDLPSLNLTDAECGSLVLCLCQWGLANKLMDVCHKWVTPLTRTAANKRVSSRWSDRVVIKKVLYNAISLNVLKRMKFRSLIDINRCVSK